MIILILISRIPAVAYLYRMITYQAKNDKTNAIADYNKTLEICGEVTDICQSTRDELSKLVIQQ